MELSNIVPLMNLDHYWKETFLDEQNQDVINPYDLSNQELFQKFPFLTHIYRDGVKWDNPSNKQDDEYILYYDDFFFEESEIFFTKKVKNFIRLVVQGNNFKRKNIFKFEGDVVVTELNNSENLNYSTTIYQCDGTLSLFIFEKERKSTTKQNTIVSLNKEGQKAFVNIVVQAQEGQKRDDYIEFQHTCKQTYSEVNYLCLNNGVVTSQANSLLDVASRQSESYQNLKHILLSEKAKSYAKPNLMIQNPDVMAKHGTNIGALNENSLEYLQMRGIDKETGKLIIQKSLIEGAIDKHPQAQHIKELYYDF